MKKGYVILYSVVFGMFSLSAQAISPEALPLQSAWEHANYELTDKQQIDAFESLTAKADEIKKQSPQQPDVLIWRGIIYASYAGIKGGLGALSMAKTAKADLEKAIEIDDQALNGSAYTTLGTLYYKVPGWPLGFGDKTTAEKLLKNALRLNPQGIDSNYFYALFLMDKKHYKQAESYLLFAKKAAPRADRPLADKGRLMEIDKALAEVSKHMNDQIDANTAN
ncbi:MULTISPECIES: hypothetical protein [unclassified Methylophaga]|jgi:tetratricopeptide (TPR) repeat protein|uniref:tetratricopeptide repeat protein n=1 Tax=unclassified Methylophaga TaxID=2629249 RepID=UPI000C9518CB|nr:MULTISPECIES: hypothetical protein [unclassified Methylophaga]MAK65477.1 hypothetical protein [Methylophaga sp.]MAY16200.1 hypothetical protein [Methylophaga sp.]HAO23980.1 hypothetical protein [Methylophaga sp.]HCD06469.1 hypothetical protein [Methylophaga sp.]|tara:strand:- start:8460 stop:9128 length:669 start_codon:yes stop_codon:yes gene_type:complete